MSRYPSPSDNSRNDAASGVRPARIERFFLLLALLLFWMTGSTTGVKAAGTITFTGEELLARPTDTSITINVIPDETVDIYYEYGTSSGGPYSVTPTGSATAGEPYNVVISGLSADTQYYYRMQYQKPGGCLGDTQRAFIPYPAGARRTFYLCRDIGYALIDECTLLQHHQL